MFNLTHSFFVSGSFQSNSDSGSQNTNSIWVLLLPKGGGQSFQFERNLIQVITPESPIGKNLIGREVDDSFEINGKLYEILSVF